jgi:hypothetical protein
MDVPQARHRVFFIANRCGFPKLRIDFKREPIRFGDVRSERGEALGPNAKISKALLEAATENDMKLEHVARRISGQGGKYFGHVIVHDDRVCQTVTSGGQFYRFADR